MIGILLAACSAKPIKTIKALQAKGVYHRVKSGETLYLIARAYNVEVQELAEANNIEDPNRIETDRVIFIPDARQVVDDVTMSMRKVDQPPAKAPPPVVVQQPRVDAASGLSTVRIRPGRVSERMADPERQDPDKAAPSAQEKPLQVAKQAPGAGEQPAPTDAPDAKQPAIQFDRKRFIWPVRGKVVSRFGIQPNGMYYNGITIAASEGAPVVAAAQGTVIFSGLLKDYGETVIIKHEDQYATVYTRLGQRDVKIEDRVRQASPIGRLGKAEGGGGEARLTFEVRHQNKARNPAFFLP